MGTSEKQLPAVAGPRIRPREGVLLISVLLLTALALFTAFLTKTYHLRVHALGVEWFSKGDAAYQAGDYQTALADYRNALAYLPYNVGLQLHVARALAATGKDEQARTYLLSLLSDSPSDGETNLELARIAVRQHRMADAVRYFHGAIYGLWETEPLAHRWEIRREFSEFLLDQKLSSQFEEELIGLEDNTPANDPEKLKVVGNLLLRARLWARALTVFQSLLVADKQDPSALQGAGTAAFQLGKYSQAVEFFGRLPEEKRKEPGVTSMMAISGIILESDPFLPGLSSQARARRAAVAVKKAQSRLENCARTSGASSSPAFVAAFQKLDSTFPSPQKDWSAASLRIHPDKIDAAISWVFDAENLAEQHCGGSGSADRALWLLGRSRAGSAK